MLLFPVLGKGGRYGGGGGGGGQMGYDRCKMFSKVFLATFAGVK